MKPLFLILLCAATLMAQIPVRMKTVTVSALPAAADAKDSIYRVSDALTVTDCISGGGSIKIQCQSDGSTWSAITANLTPSSRQILTTSPMSGGGDMSSDRTIAIADAAADGSTKGAASFTPADFNSSSGNISIDYTNGQAASASAKGFLTSTDWSTFNGKGSGNGTVTSIATTAPIGGGTITGAGTITCTTCATTTNGGALSGTSPVTVSAAGAIGCATCLTANQTVTLSGDTSGSGATSITTTLAHTYPLSLGTATAPACTNGGGTNTFVGLGNSSTTETSVIAFIPTEAYVVSKLFVTLNANVPASQTVVVTVMDNTAAQTVTCSIAAGAAVCNDTAHSFTTTAGHKIDIKVNCAGGTSATTAPVNVTLGLK